MTFGENLAISRHVGLFLQFTISNITRKIPMPTVEVSFKFTPSSPTLRYTAYVDDSPLVVTNGNASAMLEQNKEHILSWWMWGNGGDKLDMTANNGSKDILTKSSAIPATKQKAAGYGRMKP
jgi:hypothetical protein